MSSARSSAMIPTLVAVLAIGGVATAEQPAPPPDDSATGTGADTSDRPGATTDPQYHEQQVQRDRAGDLPPVGARGTGSAGTRSSETPGPRDYVVEKGDTLATIAQQELGDASQWEQIAKMNQIDDPDQLKVGTRLRLPARGENRPGQSKANPSHPANPDRGAQKSPNSGSQNRMDPR